MATITEDYVSFETAKSLKEKGFDVPCFAHWYIGTDRTFSISNTSHNWNEIKTDLDWLSCPTHQMAMKWLREVHNIHIGINPISGNGYNATIYDVADFDDYGIISDTEFFFHVEEVCEAAIKYYLENLI